MAGELSLKNLGPMRSGDLMLVKEIDDDVVYKSHGGLLFLLTYFYIHTYIRLVLFFERPLLVLSLNGHRFSKRAIA